jgi:serine/threonine-protein kinase
MELVDGRELKDPLDLGERFPLPQILKIMDELLEALGYSHAQGVVHRDIKPANIMLLADGSIKVADFSMGSMFGTPQYMAPEQLQGEQVDGRADLYAAGVVLYELLTGDRPFTGSINAVLAKALKDTPLPPSQLSGWAPQAFDPIVARALAKRPEDRFQSAQELREALRKVTVVSAGGRRRPGCALLIGAGAAAVLLGFSATFRITRQSTPSRAATEVCRKAQLRSGGADKARDFLAAEAGDPQCGEPFLRPKASRQA